jgi:hypothetical protein
MMINASTLNNFTMKVTNVGISADFDRAKLIYGSAKHVPETYTIGSVL